MKVINSFKKKIINLNFQKLTGHSPLFGNSHPLFMCWMTVCFNWLICSMSRVNVVVRLEFSSFRSLTLSSSFAMRSSFLRRHLDAATRLRCRFLSSLIFSWDSMLMGDMGGDEDATLGTVCGSSLIT